MTTEMTALQAAQHFVTAAETSVTGAQELAATNSGGDRTATNVANTLRLAQTNATLAVASALLALDDRLRVIAEQGDRSASETVDELARIRHSIDVSG